MKKTKIGLEYHKSKTDNKTILQKGSEFVSVVDGVTFGVADGQAFHTAATNWSITDQIRWAKANAMFFSQIADNLKYYAKFISKE